MYIPAAATDRNEAKAAQQKDSSKGATQDASAKDDATAYSGKADETDEAQVQPTCKPLKARDLDCHVLAVVSQGQHESITVKLLTPLGPAYNGKTAHEVEGSSDSAEVYNPATGRPYGFLLPRERQRLVKLVKALNAQFTRWTVQRIMSLTTLYREFQVTIATLLRCLYCSVRSFLYAGLAASALSSTRVHISICLLLCLSPFWDVD